MAPTKIDNPQDIRIYGQDFVSNVTVFVHDINYEWKNVTNRLKWHDMRSEHRDCIDEFLYLNLDEIVAQVGKEFVIMVMVEEPLSGVIYQYGNHGDYWEEVGELCGYA